MEHLRRLSLILILCPFAQGATYYANLGAAAGNHTGAHGDEYSFANMCDLTQEWSAGDTIWVKGSGGDLRVTDQAYGTAGLGYVTWAADSNHPAPDCNSISFSTGSFRLTIDGWDIDDGWATVADTAVYLYSGVDYLTIKNCTIQGTKHSEITSGESDFFPYVIGIAIQDVGSTTPSDYVVIENCTISNCFQGIYLKGSNCTVSGNKINSHIGSDGVVCTVTTDTITISDNTFGDINDYYSAFGWDGTTTGITSDDLYQAMTFYPDATPATARMSGIFVGWGSPVYGSPLRILIHGDDSSLLLKRSTWGNGKWKLDSDPTQYFTIAAGKPGDSAHVDGVELVGGDDGAEIIVERNWFGEGSHGQAFGKIQDNGEDPYIIVRNNICVVSNPGTSLLMMEGAGGKFYVHHNIIICTDNYASATRFHFPNRYVYNNIFSGGTYDYLGPSYVLTDADYNFYLDSEVDVSPNLKDGTHNLFNIDPTTLFVNYAGGDFNSIGVPQSAVIDAGDANNTTTSDFTAVANIRVTNAPPDIGAYEYVTYSGGNNAPVLAAIGNKTVRENRTLAFTISATDADSDPITYSCNNPPTGSTFSTATFTWKPTYYQSGTYEVRFVASDALEVDDETITVTVTDAPRGMIW